MKYSTLFLIAVFLASGCSSTKEPTPTTYPRQIGDIAYNAKQDKAAFELCAGDDMVNQYFHFGEMPFGDEKIEVLRIFQKKYDADKAAKESGLLRIRFVVNCKGETDRFRLLGMNFDYTEKQFSTSITEQ